MLELSNICYVGVGTSVNCPEHLYTQILKNDLGFGGNTFLVVPGPGMNLIQLLRDRNESVFVIIGSAELAMGKAMVFYKFMEAFQVVSKEGVRALLEYEVKIKKPGSPYKSRPPSAPRPSTPEPQNLEATLEGPKIEKGGAK
jgi:hypothetical protein